MSHNSKPAPLVPAAAEIAALPHPSPPRYDGDEEDEEMVGVDVGEEEEDEDEFEWFITSDGELVADIFKSMAISMHNICLVLQKIEKRLAAPQPQQAPASSSSQRPRSSRQ